MCLCKVSLQTSYSDLTFKMNVCLVCHERGSSFLLCRAYSVSAENILLSICEILLYYIKGTAYDFVFVGQVLNADRNLYSITWRARKGCWRLKLKVKLCKETLHIK
jgi:hypothetical protein